MSLSDKFVELRKKLSGIRTAIDALEAPRAKRGNRWNTIGPTRRKLAAILTTSVRKLEGSDDVPRFPEAVVLPENIKAMRLVGKARKWEDSFSWEAYATWPSGRICYHFYSFDNMTKCVKAGKVSPVGKDGEVSAG